MKFRDYIAILAIDLVAIVLAAGTWVLAGGALKAAYWFMAGER